MQDFLTIFTCEVFSRMLYFIAFSLKKSYNANTERLVFPVSYFFLISRYMSFHLFPFDSVLQFFSYSCMIWIKFPHVSSNIATITLSIFVGSMVNLTPSSFNFSNSVLIFSTANDVAGIPCSKSPF